MTTKAKALDRLIDAIAGEDVPMTSQTVAGRLDTLADTLAGDDVTFTARDVAGRISQLAGMIEDGTIVIGGGGDKWEPLRDGNTHFWVETFGSDDVLTISLACANPSSKPLAEFTIDWGDGSTSHPNGTYPEAYTHTYQKAGVYVITLLCENDGYFSGSSSGTFSTDRAAHNRLLYAELTRDTFNYGTSNIFTNCYRLHGLSLDGGGNIGNYICDGCYGLGKLLLDASDSWTIGSYSFQNTTIEYLNIPEGVTSISQYAFAGAEPYSVTLHSTTPPTLSNSNAFTAANVLHFYVPAASVDAYKAASNWSTYADKIQAIPA